MNGTRLADTRYINVNHLINHQEVYMLYQKNFFPFIIAASVAMLSGCSDGSDVLTPGNNGSTGVELQKAAGTEIPTEDILLEGALTATAADPLASGTARWESRPDRITFTCEVEDVTTSGSHEVRVNGVVVGFVNVVAGLGDLNMDSRNGDSVPTMNAGDRVQVRNPSGRTILRGRLAAI